MYYYIVYDGDCSLFPMNNFIGRVSIKGTLFSTEEKVKGKYYNKDTVLTTMQPTIIIDEKIYPCHIVRGLLCKLSGKQDNSSIERKLGSIKGTRLDFVTVYYKGKKYRARIFVSHLKTRKEIDKVLSKKEMHLIKHGKWTRYLREREAIMTNEKSESVNFFKKMTRKFYIKNESPRESIGSILR